MNLKEKKEILKKLKNQKKWAIPVAIIELLVTITFETIIFASMFLSGIVNTELYKIIVYTLMGVIGTLTTEMIISDVKQKYKNYEKATIDVCITEIKTEKVENNLARLTLQQKIELLKMIKNNQDMVKIISELEHLKDDGEEEFYNKVLQLLKENEEKYQQKTSIPLKKNYNNSPSKNYRRTRKK